MRAFGDVEELDELVLPYARWGVRDWARQPAGAKKRARQLKLRIAERDTVKRAVMQPFNPGSSELVLIPMPCRPKGVTCAFFLPVRGAGAVVTFELVVLLGPGELAFRIEKGQNRPGWAHGYEHIQLCKSIGCDTHRLQRVPSWVPVSYPAFPVPGRTTASRFLAMIVAMHGFADSLSNVLEIFDGRSMRRKEYSKYVKSLLGSSGGT